MYALLLKGNTMSDTKARLAALKFLAQADQKELHTYAATLCAVAKLIPEMSQDDIQKAMGLIYDCGDKLGVGEVMFSAKCWHKLAHVITDSITDSNNYTSSQLHDLVISVLGVDIDDILSVLLQQKLIRTVNRYVNGRYITVYAKNW